MGPAEPDLDQIIAKVIADAAEMLAVTRQERARREAAGEDTTIIDQVLPHLEQLAATTHKVEVFQKVQAVVDQHGAGPYPVEELATLAGADVDDVRAIPRWSSRDSPSRHQPRPATRARTEPGHRRLNNLHRSALPQVRHIRRIFSDTTATR